MKFKSSKKVHITAEIFSEDFYKISKYTNKNLSKLIRDFIKWTVSNPEVEKRIYEDGESVSRVIETYNTPNLKEIITSTVEAVIMKINK